MRRIANFDPSKATTKPYIDVGAADTGSKVLLYNESPYNIDLDFFNGSASILHAWEARYWTLDGETKQVGWTIDSSLNVTNPPISLVMGEIYDPQEKLEGSYPMALIRQASVGNPGGIQTTTNTSVGIVNDNNPSGSQMIESTLSGQSASSVLMTNDGALTIKELIGGLLVQIVKTAASDPVVALGAASHLVEVLGNLQADGTLAVTGASTFTGLATFNGGATVNGTLTASVSTAQGIQAAAASSASYNTDAAKTHDFKIGATRYAYVDNTGFHIDSGPTGTYIDVGTNCNGFKFKNGETLVRIDSFTGSGSGTYNHATGTPPTVVLIQPNPSGGGSATTGSWSYTSTQVSVTMGAALSFIGFCLKQ